MAFKCWVKVVHKTRFRISAFPCCRWFDWRDTAAGDLIDRFSAAKRWRHSLLLWCASRGTRPQENSTRWNLQPTGPASFGMPPDRVVCDALYILSRTVNKAFGSTSLLYSRIDSVSICLHSKKNLFLVRRWSRFSSSKGNIPVQVVRLFSFNFKALFCEIAGLRRVTFYDPNRTKLWKINAPSFLREKSRR